MKCNKCKNLIQTKEDLTVGYGSRFALLFGLLNFIRAYHKKCLEEINSKKLNYPILNINTDQFPKLKVRSILEICFLIIILIVVFTVLPYYIISGWPEQEEVEGLGINYINLEFYIFLFGTLIISSPIYMSLSNIIAMKRIQDFVG